MIGLNEAIEFIKGMTDPKGKQDPHPYQDIADYLEELQMRRKKSIGGAEETLREFLEEHAADGIYRASIRYTRRDGYEIRLEILSPLRDKGDDEWNE